MIKDISLAKEKLKTLAEIDSEVIGSMTEKQLIAFIEALNVAAFTFPMQKKELMAALEEKEYTEIFQWLSTILGGLSQVRADNLARECEYQIELNSDLSKVRHEKVKAFLDYIIPSLELFFDDVHDVFAEIEVTEGVTPTEDTQTPESAVTPKIVREKLLTIEELDSKIIGGMSDNELSEYLNDLDSYHTNYLSLRSGLTSAIKIKHYVFVLQWLNTVEDILMKVHATDLAASCRDQIAANKDFNNIRHDKLSVYVNYILSTMSMLSTDIISLGLPKKLTAAKGAVPKAEFEVLTRGASEGSKKILVVNKMMMFMNSFKNALSDSGFTLIGITSAESAAVYVQSEKPDLFILDDDLKGSQLLLKIIRASGHLAPIIFTTSKITKDKMREFMEAGVADFIMKPITPSEVQKKVSKHLS